MTRTATLRKVMKAAWTIFRQQRVSFSAALTKAWAWAKKNLTATTSPKRNDGRVCILSDASLIAGQTEKALKVVVEVIEQATGRRIMHTSWLPKSQVVIENGEVFGPQWLAARVREEMTGFRAA